eukprot:CAMPEP_0185440860 /NCGR_PEP_ID=MMETSP1365-20130426/40999_1 /TAXON_ID=38817 /ORGANISM="Gephyrocapsa oceanica, Strain RCC1303" /LENGTH=427 /DNA_ID=CAMNT_0028046285 /DNA_START=180 /DNA_END=1464 /DNA_ORIENTATION=-
MPPPTTVLSDAAAPEGDVSKGRRSDAASHPPAAACAPLDCAEAASVLWRRHVVLRPPAADRVLRLEVGRDGERLLALDLLPLPHRVAHVPDRRRRLQHDDRLARHLRPVGDVDPNLDRRAARRADQQALLRGDAVGPLARLWRRRVRKLVDCAPRPFGPLLAGRQLLDERQLQVGPDPDDAVHASRRADQHTRLGGLDADDAARGLLRLEVLARPVERASRPRARHEAVHLAVGLLPDLRAGASQVRERVVFRVELRGGPVVRVLLDELGRVPNQVLDRLREVVLHHRREVHVAPKLAYEDVALVHAWDLRHHDDALVALGGRHHRQPDAGVARRGLDNGGTRRVDIAALLRLFDHRECDPVLDRAARVLHLELEIHLSFRIADDPPQPDHGRRPDNLSDALNATRQSASVPRQRARGSGQGSEHMC